MTGATLERIDQQLAEYWRTHGPASIEKIDAVRCEDGWNVMLYVWLTDGGSITGLAKMGRSATPASVLADLLEHAPGLHWQEYRRRWHCPPGGILVGWRRPNIDRAPALFSRSQLRKSGFWGGGDALYLVCVPPGPP